MFVQLLFYHNTLPHVMLELGYSVTSLVKILARKMTAFFSSLSFSNMIWTSITSILTIECCSDQA